MQILLDLKKHCIQTALRQKYNQRIRQYFKTDPTEKTKIGQMETEIDLLKTALEQFDFGRLRSTYPELRGGGSDEIILQTDTDNRMTLSINNRKIHETNTNHEIL